MDCGAKAASTIGYNIGNKIGGSTATGNDEILFSGTVGRITLSGRDNAPMTKEARVRVAPYDEKVIPAIMLFPDEKCNTIPRRYFFDPDMG